MDRNCMACVVSLVAVALQISTARGERSPQEIFDELSQNTSNTWGCCKSAFDAVAQSNMSALAAIDTVESRELRAQWLMNLSRMCLPSNDLQYSVWLKVKVLWLTGSGRYFMEPGSTNLWYAVADVLGEIRRGLRNEADIVAEYRSTVTNSVLEACSGCPMSLMNALAALGAQRDSDAMLSRLMVETYGRRGLKRLDANVRPSVVSNLIIRARLTPVERSTLQNYAK